MELSLILERKVRCLPVILDLSVICVDPKKLKVIFGYISLHAHTNPC